MSFTTRTVDTNGIRLAVAEAGRGFPVVLCHGFPELAFSWRHQLPVLAEAGFHALAPDQRGYGASDRPDAIEAYDIHHLTADLVGLLDAFGHERAVFVGHDWGGLVAWQMPLLHPERTAAVVGVNTPYLPRPPAPPTRLFRAMFGERHYVVHFQTPGPADAGLARDVRRTFETLMRRGVPLAEIDARLARDGMRNMVDVVEAGEPLGAPLLDDDALDVYVRAFEGTGFTGGLNWYRNLDRNWETTPTQAGARIGVPSLMIAAEWDPVLRPELVDVMRPLVDDLEAHVVAACGHWTPQEKPAEVNRLLVDWLRRRFGATA